MADLIDENVIQRIQDIYASSPPSEQAILRQVLEEVAIHGESQTYRDIWLADFKEVPVSIDRFISDPYYMGRVNRNGEAVYPFWKHTIRDIFEHGNQYNEIALSGATRIGKTSTAIIILAYMLYKLMLYRNPHEYFQKKEVSKFTVGFANLTKELAAGVAFREFNDTLKECPWFMDRGKISRSDKNFYYVPEGDKIEIIAGSDSAHFLGKQCWCLSGDTQIVTADGVKTLQSCAGSYQDIVQLTDDGLQYTSAYVAQTATTDTLLEVELEDGSIIRGTPDHKVMLTDESYKAISDLSSSDNLLAFNARRLQLMKIKSIKKIKYDKLIPVYDVLDVQPNHNFVIISGDTLAISHNCIFIDEVNFTKAGVKDINLAKQHMKNLYDTVNARISGTFKIEGETYGKLITASSKNTDSDFLSNHIEAQLNAGNTHLYLVDKPQWEVLPPSMFSKEKFHFTVGDRYKKGFVIPEENDDEAHRREYINQGYQIIEAPAEFRRNFIADYDISLRDIAGISVVGAMGFITQAAITPNITDERKNPFYTDVISVGTQDKKTIEEFFHLESVPPRLKNCLMNIHLDLSETGDRTGMAGVCIDGTKIVTDFDGRKISMPFFKEIFSVGIQRPAGDRLSFQKVVNFLLWLRRNGFNIGTVSTDQYQSSYLREVLNGQGFKTDKISVDRSEEPYIGLKNILYDQRIELVRNELRDLELINLQQVNNKIDHPLTLPSGGKGSKDVSDCVCGACYTLTLEHSQPIPEPSHVASAIAAVNNRGTSATRGLSMFADPHIYNRRK